MALIKKIFTLAIALTATSAASAAIAFFATPSSKKIEKVAEETPSPKKDDDIDPSEVFA